MGLKKTLSERLFSDSDILIMGDLNHATTVQDRESRRLHKYDQEYQKWVQEWELIDIWTNKMGVHNHYTYRKEQNEAEASAPGNKSRDSTRKPQIMSRIDYALCSPSLLPWVEGIGLDTIQRLRGMDHRVLMVDLNPAYSDSTEDRAEVWLPEEPEFPTEARIRIDNWGKEERKEFRNTLHGMMEEEKKIKVVTKKEADLVYVGGRDRRYKDGTKGEWWKTTRDPMRALQWAIDSDTGAQITVRALDLNSSESKTQGQLCLDTAQKNQKMGIKG